MALIEANNYPTSQSVFRERQTYGNFANHQRKGTNYQANYHSTLNEDRS